MTNPGQSKEELIAKLKAAIEIEDVVSIEEVIETYAFHHLAMLTSDEWLEAEADFGSGQ